MGACSSSTSPLTIEPRDLNSDCPLEHTSRALDLAPLHKCDDTTAVWAKYRRGDLLGRGMYGVVRKATERKSGREFAIKSVATSRLRASEVAQLREEITIMRSLDHPNVVRLFEAYETPLSVFLVLELCTGGALVDHVRGITEREAARVVRKLLLALRHCHALGIVHRDVKPENFVYDARGGEPKLVDFGLARALTESSSMQTFCGTLPYVAPECFRFRRDNEVSAAGAKPSPPSPPPCAQEGEKEGYDARCDIWSTGVFAHVMLCGELPFEDATHAAAAGRPPKFDAPKWKFVSSEARAFVTAALRVDPEARPSAREALDLAWIARSQQAQDVASDVGAVQHEETQALQRIAAFRDMSLVKRAALAFIAHRIHSPRCKSSGGVASSKAEELLVDEGRSVESALEQLRATFQRIDSHCTGVVSRAELMQAFAESGLPVTTSGFDALFEAMDLDASNGISYTQFLAATLESSAVDEGLWTEAYEAMDIDGTGAVTVENLKTCLAEWGDDELAAAIAEADLSGDGVVSKEEFLAVCRSSEKIGDVRERYLGELLGL